MYKTVVVGTDGSETAQEAVRHAAKLAAATEARLVIATAYTPHDDIVARRSGAPEDVRWMLSDRNLAEEQARQARQVAKAVGANEVLIESSAGDPADVLIDLAKEHEADVIVVGSRGLTSPAHFVLGSVASSVSHHARCDVLIVHTV
jgi:nucleotide-binding universal stress UspA family protein